MNEASTPDFKADIRRLIAYCENQMKKLSVRVVMGEATEDALSSFDAVVAATGSHPITMKIPGYDRKNVRTAADVLNGAPCPGKRVVIIGGGSVGAETGIWLAEQGKEVTIVEMREEILLDEMAATKIVDLGMIQKLGITLLPCLPWSGLTRPASPCGIFRSPSTPPATRSALARFTMRSTRATPRPCRSEAPAMSGKILLHWPEISVWIAGVLLLVSYFIQGVLETRTLLLLAAFLFLHFFEKFGFPGGFPLVGLCAEFGVRSEDPRTWFLNRCNAMFRSWWFAAWVYGGALLFPG